MAQHKQPVTAPQGAAIKPEASQDALQSPATPVAEASAEATVIAADAPAAEASPAAVAAPEAPVIETFPARYRITNNTPSSAAFPVIKALVEAYGSTVVEIREKSHLRQFREDAKRLEALNGWTNGFTAEREE